MKNEGKVCSCNMVTVDEVLNFVKNNKNKVINLKDLRIGTRCKQCLQKDCPIIDTHYSEILGDIKVG